MTLLDVITPIGEQPDEVLRLAGALENSSEHPIAKAIATGARDKLGELPDRRGIHEPRRARACRASVDGHTVWSGRRQLLELGAAASREGRRGEAEADGTTAVAVGWDGTARGVLVVADAVKPTSADAVTELRALGSDADHADRRQRGGRPHGRRAGRVSTR